MTDQQPPALTDLVTELRRRSYTAGLLPRNSYKAQMEEAEKALLSAVDALTAERDVLAAACSGWQACVESQYLDLERTRAENAALRRQLERTGPDGDAAAEVARLRAHLVSAAEALRLYGEHRPDCDTRRSNTAECDCSLVYAQQLTDAALACPVLGQCGGGAAT